MSHVQPVDPEGLADLKPVFDEAERLLGFMPNDLRIMAHMPQLPVALMMLASCVFGGDLKAGIEKMAPVTPEPDGPDEGLPHTLITLIAYSASLSAGCMYCTAHTSSQVQATGVPEEKYTDILNFEESDTYTSAERAAIALAFAGARLPNEATPKHFEALREHFTERQIVQIVSVIALFGFLNRWNDTLATALEAHPKDFASEALSKVNWEAGKHG